MSRGWDVDHPPANPALHLRAGIIPDPSAAHSSGALTSHLSPRKLCLLSVPQNHCQICLPCCWTLTARAQGLSRPAAAHWTDLGCSTDQAGISQPGILLFLCYWLSEGWDYIFSDELRGFLRLNSCYPRVNPNACVTSLFKRVIIFYSTGLI